MEPTEPGRHALLIGVRYSPRIFHHPCLRIRENYFQLSSDRDVDLMRELLVDRFGFPEGNTRVLKTEEATREAILAAVAELVERVDPDDVVVLYYSGHGSRMRDPMNPDGVRETLVPYDSSRGGGWVCDRWRDGRLCRDVRSFDEVEWEDLCGPGEGRGDHDENRDVRDQEIDGWVQELNKKTPYVTLIFDCCHSGSLHRPPGVVREVVPDPRTSSEIDESGQRPSLFAGSRGLEERLDSGWLTGEGRRMVMVAACRADEYSWERDQEPSFGLLTYHLHSTLDEVGTEATWMDVLEAVAPKVSGEQSTQHPQLEGEIDLRVFGRTKDRARSYLPVVRRSEVVDLWGGAAHGVSLGSLWTIRPRGTRSRHQGEELARVRIERLRPATARGRVVEGALASPLKAGQRAFLLEENLPSPGLKVAIAAPENRSEKLVELLEESELLAVVGGPVAEDDGDAPEPEPDGGGQWPESADVIAHCLAPRETVEPGEPCPSLGPLTEWTWAIVDGAGQLQVRRRGDHAVGVELLTADLVKLARFKGLRRLENPDPESRLRDRIDLRILHQREPEQPPELAREDEEHGVVVVEEGDRVDFEIENQHDEQVWVSLVELDSDHSITVVMPRRGHPTFRRGGQSLAPGEILRVGADYYRARHGMRQRLPDDFPWAGGEGDSPEVGISYFKLLVTSVAADFEFVEQEDTRFLATHPLERLTLLYHSNRGTRTVILPPEDLLRDEDWAVVTRGLGIRRRRQGE